MTTVLPLAGRVALVTGCSRVNGIGRAIVERLSSDGADVVAADYCRRLDGYEIEFGRREELDDLVDAVEQKGRRAVAVDVDVTAEKEVEAMVRRAVGEFGRIDILCNNAGGSVGAAPVLELALDAWSRTLAINATSAFLCAKHVAPVMIAEGRGGRIVNTASILAKEPLAGAAGYVSGKHALLGLTRTLVLELARHRITCNAVCPGEIATHRRTATAPTRSVPLDRLGQPEEVAGAIAYLVSDDAAYVTGQAFSVDGGLTM